MSSYSLIMSSPSEELKFRTVGGSVHMVYHRFLGAPGPGETLSEMLRRSLRQVTIEGLGTEESAYLQDYISKNLGKKVIRYEDKLKLEVYRV